MEQFWTWVHRAASVAILIIFVLGIVRQFPKTPTGFKMGDKVPALAEWDYTGRTSTIVFASTTCPFCNESIGFYQSMIGPNFVLAYHEPAEVVAPYLKTKGYTGNWRANVSMTNFKVTGFPTIYLVNAEGELTLQEQGKLPPEKEKAFSKGQ